MRSLTFFVVCIAGLSCRPSPPAEITIQWQTTQTAERRATGLIIPRQAVQSVPSDSLQWLTVRLAGRQTAMLGWVRLADGAVVFEPLASFTRGLRYTVWLRDKLLGDITIPRLNTRDRPALLGIYPSSDSLPDNLLKVYLRFSRAMREGQSKQYVSLLKNGNDTLPGVFLDLQPELWNGDRTLLTLWLDPGRIKRELQPNKRLGAPLQAGGQYTLVVSANWPDQQGAVLGKEMTKSFRAVGRDSLSPRVGQWTIRQPAKGSRQPLTVAFGEALDYSLLTETLHVLTDAGKPVAGRWQRGDREKQGLFVPVDPWVPGRYTLRAEGRLEDLAGNNLTRPFDRDLTRNASAPVGPPAVALPFRVAD